MLDHRRPVTQTDRHNEPWSSVNSLMESYAASCLSVQHNNPTPPHHPLFQLFSPIFLSILSLSRRVHIKNMHTAHTCITHICVWVRTCLHTHIDRHKRTHTNPAAVWHVNKLKLELWFRKARCGRAAISVNKLVMCPTSANGRTNQPLTTHLLHTRNTMSL